MKRIASLLLLSIFLASCANAETPAPTVTVTSEATVTFTPAPTEIPSTPTPDVPETPTETPDPLAGAPGETTGFDENGDPIREVIYENGQTFEFHLNEQGEWVRPAGRFPFMDNGQWEYIPFSINISENVKGGETFIEVVHPNAVDDINRPITKRIRSLFAERLGLSTQDEEFYRLMNVEMDKGSESDAKLPIITSDGEETFVRLSNENGFIVNIVSADEMVPFFEAKRAVQWFDGHGTYYLRVTVDEQHNAVCTVASSLPLNELNNKEFRDFLVSCISHVFTQVDQREFFNYSNAQGLGNSAAAIVDSTGKPDMEIVIAE